MSDATHVLNAIEAGDPKAADQLLPLVYEELRKLAAVRMANEKVGQTWQPTALVHEAWLKIAGNGGEQFANRRHFFKAGATAMQQILKHALEYRNVSDRVRLSVPGEYESLTLAAWVGVQGLDRQINFLFMSDGFVAGTVHWTIRQDGVLALTAIGSDPGRYQILAALNKN